VRNVFDIPQNFFCTFEGRRKVDLYDELTLIKNANDFALFSGSVENYFANLELRDWYFTPSLGLVAEVEILVVGKCRAGRYRS
jgi:hypothetical protein